MHGRFDNSDVLLVLAACYTLRYQQMCSVHRTFGFLAFGPSRASSLSLAVLRLLLLWGSCHNLCMQLPGLVLGWQHARIWTVQLKLLLTQLALQLCCSLHKDRPLTPLKNLAKRRGS